MMFESPTGRLTVRGHDAYGAGAYLAARTTGDVQRQHMGVDLVCKPGQILVAPCDGVITRVGYAYPGDLRYQSVHIQPNTEPTVDIKLLYVACDRTELEKVERGLPLGRSQDLDIKYPGITQHTHMEVIVAGQHVDPMQYLEATTVGFGNGDLTA